jgi:deoxycytidylate deaminase
MKGFSEAIANPELVFGLVGPIGVDMDMIQNQLAHCLRSVGYEPVSIRVTDLMTQVSVAAELVDSTDPIQHYGSRIEFANAVRARCENDAALAALAVLEIRLYRQDQNEHDQKTSLSDQISIADIPLESHAFIIRQLKRPEEIGLLRKVYGRKFIQISVSLGVEERQRLITNKISSKNPNLSSKEASKVAEELVLRDMNEQAVPHGQRIEDVFHLGDVFVSARSEAVATATIKRFVEALFGRNSISPNRDEYASYIAASAALRSIDTARQVGAAIFSTSGEVVSLGCNEVPAPGGGTYWTDHPEPHRDYDDGFDANHAHKRRIAYDFIRRLREAKILNLEGTDEQAFERVMSTDQAKNSLLMDITEFGRMAHAEMNALLDAARLGRPTKGATLFSTTFPCHNCAKHIITAGIKRVVYVEPYPKSQALDLHNDAMTTAGSSGDKVVFEHFVGISPRRYRDIFEKGKRRKSDGSLEDWYEGRPVPRVEDKSPYYVFNESSAAYSALEKVAHELGIVVEQKG